MHTFTSTVGSEPAIKRAGHDHFSIPSSALGCSCPSPDVDRLATDVTVRGLSSSDQKLNEATVMRVETILLPVMSALLVLTQRPSLQRNISRGIVCLARSGILLRRPSEFTGMAPYSNDKSPVDAAMCFALFFASRVDIDFRYDGSRTIVSHNIMLLTFLSSEVTKLLHQFYPCRLRKLSQCSDV